MAGRKVNKKLLRKTLATVIVADESPVGGMGWSQKFWRCKSGMCFAGWAVTLAGWKPVLPKAQFNRLFNKVAVSGGYYAWESDTARPLFEVRKGRKTGQIAAVARRELGITGEQAEELFEPDNDLSGLVDHVLRIERGS